jgi:hypothetical protein
VTIGASAPTGAQPPPVELPKLPKVPQPPPLPSVPDVPGVQVPSAPPAPSVQAPSVQAPSVPSAGGGAGGVGPGVPGLGVGTAVEDAAAGASAGGGSAAGAGVPQRPGSAPGGPGSAPGGRGSAPGSRGGSGSAPRERRLRRKVRRLAPCLDAVSSLERRVLVLRAGLGRARPHSRSATARKLGISVRRAVRAEHRGLSGISRANGATGCGHGGGGGESAAGSGGFATIAARAPIVAQVLGLSPAPSSGGGVNGTAPAQEVKSGFAESAAPAFDLAQAAAQGVASAAEENGPLPFVVLLAMLAMAVAAAAILQGRRLAGDALDRRSEAADDRRHQELVTAVRDILGERQHR